MLTLSEYLERVTVNIRAAMNPLELLLLSRKLFENLDRQDLRHNPFVFHIPDSIEAQIGFLFKFDDNGDSYVASPSRLNDIRGKLLDTLTITLEEVNEDEIYEMRKILSLIYQGQKEVEEEALPLWHVEQEAQKHDISKKSVALALAYYEHIHGMTG